MIELTTKKKDDVSVEVEQKVELVQFSKEQILTSKKFCNNRDLVDALLDESKKYTIEQVSKLIDSYKKGQVK